jgi:hypothetical protein
MRRRAGGRTLDRVSIRTWLAAASILICATGGAAIVGACSSTDGGASDGSVVDVATDAADEPDVTPPSCGPVSIDFTYQLEGGAPRAACVPLSPGVRVAYTSGDAGPCTIAGNDFAGATPSYFVHVTTPENVFASAGTYSVRVELEAAEQCGAATASQCPPDIGLDCSFTVTKAGGVDAAVVEGALAAPCALPWSGQPPTQVALQALHVVGPVVANVYATDASTCP